ncbi:MAG TPA: glycosyltransferase family 2 protein, partial [bacterium]|nr:glycosyltransferase family 2 protein [bacterium]
IRSLTAATGDLIFFIDADVVPAPDCLARLAAALAAAPRAAGAGARIQEQSRSLWDDYRAHYLAQNPAPDALFLPGLAVLYHIAILRKAGGFDPAYRTNGEDYALGLRLSAAGHTLLHAPEAHVEHHRHDTCVSFVRLLWRYHYFEELVRRRQKLPWFWNQWLLPPLNLLAVSRRILFVERAPALLLPALLALPVRWWAAGCLTVGRP